jgi:predicted metal-binding membrane protein
MRVAIFKADMDADSSSPAKGQAEPPSRLGALLTGASRQARLIVGATVLAWACLVWMAMDMGHPLIQLTMPGNSDWDQSNVLAIFVMWSVMMAAMMLPSALPMILTFSHINAQSGEQGRTRMFVVAYLLVWVAFSAIATALQWALQAADWVDPMIVSMSPVLNGVLLAIAGVYQFSPLKKVCLARCRTPFGFLMGEWRPGQSGAFRMGVRHGLFCAGCCWAVMALLFVGGVMNLAWIAALAIVVAIEKMAPRGAQLSVVLGVVLILSGVWRLFSATLSA